MSEDGTAYGTTDRPDIDSIVEATNAVTVPDKTRAALVAELGPIADKLTMYLDIADNIVVRNAQEADEATQHCERIRADIKTVTNCDVLSRITEGLHKLHRQWTTLRGEFVGPLQAADKTIKNKIIAWQEAERRKAGELQRKLQAEADEKARRERARLEAEAAKLKSEAKREERLAAAAAVVTPTIHIEAPRTTLKGVSRRWVVVNLDKDAFFRAAATDMNLRGYVEIDQVRLQRAKSANPELTVPGVVFEHRLG